MDGQRFDNATRLIGRGASRRSVVKALVAGLTGGFAGWRGLPNQAAAATICIEEGELCTPDLVPCCADLACVGGPVRTCQSLDQCVAEGEACDFIGGTTFCCPPAECVFGQAGGVCVVPDPCAATGEACGELGCCNGNDTCLGGVCVACAGTGEACGDVPCCSSSAGCIDGVCTFECTPQDAECAGDTCCGDLVCAETQFGLRCSFPCAALGEICGVNEPECCDGVECIDGVCGGGGEPTCRVEGETCNNDLEGDLLCCSLLICNESGVCEPDEGTCAEEGDACGDDNADIPCCGDLVCLAGECQVVSGGAVGDDCESDSDCRGDLICDDGICAEDANEPAPEPTPDDPDEEPEEPEEPSGHTPDGESPDTEGTGGTTLPSTGVGQNQDTFKGESLLGAGLAAGAAAILAGHALRGKTQTNSPTAEGTTDQYPRAN